MKEEIEIKTTRFHNFMCAIGIHQWKSDSDYFTSNAGGGEVCLFWWECVHCHASKLKHITR